MYLGKYGISESRIQQMSFAELEAFIDALAPKNDNDKSNEPTRYISKRESIAKHKALYEARKAEKAAKLKAKKE